MKICCLMTGRGNNTLKDKNILDVLGHPVLYYGANAAKKTNVFDCLYCSSDDDKILSEAEKNGFKRIKRPDALGAPTAQHIDCILHAIDFMKKNDNYVPDILCVLLANNVTVTSKMITDCINIMEEDYDNVSAVCPVYADNDHHPLRCKKIIDGKLVSYTNETVNSTNRQDLPQCVFLAHNIWVINVKKLLNKEYGEGPWTFLGKNVIPYLIEESIDIHDQLDIIKAAYWINHNYID